MLSHNAFYKSLSEYFDSRHYPSVSISPARRVLATGHLAGGGRSPGDNLARDRVV